MAMSGSTYILEGRESELAQHRGHQIEVTGTLAASTSPGAGSSSGSAGSGATTSPGATGSGNTTSGTTAASGGSSSSSGSMAGAGQRVQVTSVRMISSTCTQ